MPTENFKIEFMGQKIEGEIIDYWQAVEYIKESNPIVSEMFTSDVTLLRTETGQWLEDLFKACYSQDKIWDDIQSKL